MNHDKIFKQLLTTFFFEFVDLLLPEVAAYLSRDYLEFLDKELFTDLNDGDSQEVDVVAKARFADGDAFFLLHVEDESQKRPRFPRRMFHYFARLDEKYDLPVYPIGLLSYEAPRTPHDDRYKVIFPNETVLNFWYHAVQLNRLKWEDFAERDNPVAAALMTRMHIEPADRPRVKLACVRMMLRLSLNDAQRDLVGRFVDSYLELDDSEQAGYELGVERLAPVEKEKVMTVMNEWTRKGLEKGREEGMAEGKREMCLRLLRSRLGEVRLDLQERVRQLSVGQVERLGDSLFTIATTADLEAWLKSA